MAEKRTRRSFTREFKAQAVKRLLDGGRGLSEVATELGLSTGQLSTWRSEHLAAGSAEALALRKAEEAETQRLKRENKRWPSPAFTDSVTRLKQPLGTLLLPARG